MKKNCPFFQNAKIKKHGTSNNIQRYFCHKTFSFKNKLDPIKIWTDYTSGKQTYQQLAVKYHCSVRTIQRYIDKVPKTVLKSPLNRYLNIIMDTMFFGRYFGVLVVMDSNANNVISHYFVRTEKDIYHKLAGVIDKFVAKK